MPEDAPIAFESESVSEFESINEIIENLKRYSDVQAAWLFGSYAEDTAKIDSDLDIGLAGNPDKIKAVQLEMLTDFSREGIDRVDLVILERADLVLKFEILHHNQLIFSRRDFDFAAVVSKVLREYFDFMPYLERQRKALKERLLNG